MYGSAAVGEIAEQAPAYLQRVDLHSPSPFTTFNNSLYEIPEKQFQATQHHTHSEPLQSHVYGNIPNQPVLRNTLHKLGFEMDGDNDVHLNKEFHHSETISSPTDVEFHNVIYEATDTIAV